MHAVYTFGQADPKTSLLFKTGLCSDGQGIYQAPHRKRPTVFSTGLEHKLIGPGMVQGCYKARATSLIRTSSGLFIAIHLTLHN